MKRPKTKPARTIGATNQDVAPPPEAKKQKGDLMIHDIGQNRTDSVHDMSFVNTEAKNHTVKTPDKCVQEA